MPLRQGFFLLALSLLFGSLMGSPAFASSLPHPEYPGTRSITYRLGPIRVMPGENKIHAVRTVPAPRSPGFITRFQPDLVIAKSGAKPAVDSLHVHHAGWTIGRDISFSSGEEKTIVQYPRGFGLPVSGRENWSLVYMLHNQISKPENVYLTWRVDFTPRPAPIKPVYVRWMDVTNTSPYGVFDALRGWGRSGRYTFPDQAVGSQRRLVAPSSRWMVGEDVTLVYTVGHLHPGGLWTTMQVTRDGVTKRLFRSRAKYFDSSAPFSYDMALSSTPPDWKVRLRKGDLVSISSTIDTSRVSWREQMGVMPAVVYRGHDVGGIDPFTSRSGPAQGEVFSHGSLPENRGRDGLASGLVDPRSLPDGPRVSRPVKIENFRYQFGDFLSSGLNARPPVVSAGDRLSFLNMDSSPGEVDSAAYHTVTACRAPCTATSGPSCPRADSSYDFDSGQLGIGEYGLPPASGRLVWSTPRSLPPGTYTFFCRIHPSMRGAFRVKTRAGTGRLAAGWPSLPSS